MSETEPKNTGQERVSIEVALGTINGYFDGKLDEIGLEIEEVAKWTRSIKLGSRIERKDQKLAHLEDLKKHLEHAKAFIERTLSR